MVGNPVRIRNLTTFAIFILVFLSILLVILVLVNVSFGVVLHNLAIMRMVFNQFVTNTAEQQ